MRNELIASRLALKLTQAEVASELDISRSFYGLIEIGLRNPNYGLAKKIAQLLKVRPENIFFDLDGFIMKQKTDNQCQRQPPDPQAVCLPKTG